jgi:hypothetical protein
MLTALQATISGQIDKDGRNVQKGKARPPQAQEAHGADQGQSQGPEGQGVIHLGAPGPVPAYS